MFPEEATPKEEKINQFNRKKLAYRLRWKRPLRKKAKGKKTIK